MKIRFIPILGLALLLLGGASELLAGPVPTAGCLSVAENTAPAGQPPHWSLDCVGSCEENDPGDCTEDSATVGQVTTYWCKMCDTGGQSPCCHAEVTNTGQLLHRGGCSPLVAGCASGTKCESTPSPDDTESDERVVVVCYTPQT